MPLAALGPGFIDCEVSPSKGIAVAFSGVQVLAEAARRGVLVGV
jgi:hypothetical protein